MSRIKFGFLGTKHAHALAKMQVLQAFPAIEVVGVFEPDNTQRSLIQKTAIPFKDIHFYDNLDEMIHDKSIIAIVNESLSCESLQYTDAIIKAGKHCWYDKPAGDNFIQFQQILSQAKNQQIHIQMGYMFRYHDGFNKIASLVKSGILGDIFSIRAQMSVFIPAVRGTSLNFNTRDTIANHKGGILYDLGCHIIDQVCWLLGRPTTLTAFLRNDSGCIPTCMDNTLGVLEYPKSLVTINIAAMEVPNKQTRRFEVNGTKGSAILVEPFEQSNCIHLYLEKAVNNYQKGFNMIPYKPQTRNALYKLELDAFLNTINKKQVPSRSIEHELLVQETLLRLTNPSSIHV